MSENIRHSEPNYRREEYLTPGDEEVLQNLEGRFDWEIIAEVLDSSVDAVKARCYRAVEKLRVALSQDPVIQNLLEEMLAEAEDAEVYALFTDTDGESGRDLEEEGEGLTDWDMPIL